MVMIQSESLGLRAGTLPSQRDEIEVLHGQDDDALLARLRAGDEAAFRMLVDRHRPWLVRLCTRLLGQDAHAAEDAAQESLLKLHRAVRRDGRPLRVRPWLTVVARNTCVDEQRRRRPDLPGELPERAVAGVDPFDLDVPLSDAWSRLSGRHREVLYLREVLGFSYKEIGTVMDLSMAATETLVFRARAALKREYERSGGTSFGSALLGFQLARLGVGRRREGVVTDGVANAAVTDPGFTSLTSRLAHFLSTSLPGCGEQAVAKVLTVAAGMVMAAAAVIPGLGPFGDAPHAEAAGGPSPVVLSAGAGVEASAVNSMAAGSSAGASKAPSLKSLLGNAAPGDWTPQRSRTETKPPATVAAPSPAAPDARPRITPLRDAASTARSADRPALNRPVVGDRDAGRLRSILPDHPEVARPERPAQPVRSLLADPVPFLIDPLPPVESTPVEPAPVDPVPAEPVPVPDQESRPKVRDAVEQGKDAVAPGDDNVAGHEPALLRRRNG